MEGVEGEVVMGKDEVSEGYEEMCSRAGGMLHLYNYKWAGLTLL